MKIWQGVLWIVTLASPVLADRAVSVEGVMGELAERQHRVEVLLSRGPQGTELATQLEALDGLFSKLEGLYDPSYNGDPAHWRTACGEGRATVAAKKQAVADNDLARAKREFGYLGRLRERAHGEFRPGLFQRLFHRRKSTAQDQK